MTESTDKPDLANAQVTGGGGHEPDPDLQAPEAPEPAASGSGVDLKSDELPDPNE
jgi:hypothetical protein